MRQSLFVEFDGWIGVPNIVFDIMNKFTLTVLRNSTAGMAAQIAIKLLSFGFSVFIVRSLGAEEFGQYAAAAAYGMMFIFIADLGLSPYAVREVARWRDVPEGREQTEQLYGNILTLRFFLSILAGLLTILTAWLTGRPWVMIGAIVLNSFGLVMYSLQGASEAVIAGFERLDLAAGAKVFNQLIFVGLGAAALYLGLGYYGLIYATLIGIALLTYVCWQAVRSLKIFPHRPSPAAWRLLLRASLPFGLIGFALGLSYKFDSVLLNIFWGDEITGYYAAVYNLIFSVVVISNVINAALYPSLARQSISSAHRLPQIYERMLRYLMIIALPIAVGGSVLAAQLVPFLFTTNYAPAVPALQILIWVIPFMFASEFLGYIVVIAGKEGRVARAVVISTGINVGLNLLLVPLFGFFAASVMTVLTEAVLVGQYLWLLRALIRPFNWGQILVRPLLAALGMGLVVLIFSLYLPFLVNVLLGAVIYTLLLPLFGVAGRDEWYFLRGILASRTSA